MSFISGGGGGYAVSPPGPPPAQQGNYGTLGLLATTGPGGFVLQNATPIIFSFKVPNDGLLHRFLLYGILVVTVTEVGGGVQMNNSGGGGWNAALFASNTAGPATRGNQLGAAQLGDGTVLNLQQVAALTGGAATLYAELWGS